MSRIVLAGPDPTDLGQALEGSGATVSRIEGPVTDSALRDAGIDDADVFVLTDPEEATGIALARERDTDVRIVVVSADAVPPFAGHLADLILDPAAFEQSVLVEELLDAGA